MRHKRFCDVLGLRRIKREQIRIHIVVFKETIALRFLFKHCAHKVHRWQIPVAHGGKTHIDGRANHRAHVARDDIEDRFKAWEHALREAPNVEFQRL